jgi:hypothetical protein
VIDLAITCESNLSRSDHGIGGARKAPRRCLPDKVRRVAGESTIDDRMTFHAVWLGVRTRWREDQLCGDVPPLRRKSCCDEAGIKQLPSGVG